MTILRPTRREVRSLLLYLIDWIFVGGTALVAFAFGKLTPNLRPFSIEDPTISYPFQNNAKIPSWLLAILSTIVPGVLIALIICVLPKHRGEKLKTRLWMLNTVWLGLGVALTATLLVTNGMKNLCGKPRPDFISRCAPVATRLANESFRVGDRYFSAEVCASWDGISEAGLGKNKLLDGFRSWVSGHASSSFAGLTYLTIFLSYHLHSRSPVQNTQKPPAHNKISHSSAPLLLIISIPVLLACYIATTRYSDFRHDGIDIVFGSLLGIGTAFLGWSWYGSRSIYWTRGFGGLGREKGNSNGDLELGMVPAAEGVVNGSDSVIPSGDTGQIFSEDESVERQRQLGETVESESKGVLQLREMNLSISTLGRAEEGNCGRSTEIPFQDNSAESLCPSTSQEGSSGVPTGTEKRNMI